MDDSIHMLLHLGAKLYVKIYFAATVTDNGQGSVSLIDSELPKGHESQVLQTAV